MIGAVYVVLATFISLIRVNNAILGGILFAVLIGSCVALAIYCYVFCVKSIKLLTFIVSGILCIITFVSFNIICNNWVSNIDKEKSYTVSGIIDSMVKDESGDQRIVLSQVYIDGDSIKGKIQIDVDSALVPFDKLLGYKVSFNSKLFPQELIDGYSVNSVAYRKDIRYKAYPKMVNFEYRELTFRAKLLDDINNVLFIAMGEDYGSIAFSMLTGDKNNLDYGIVDYFSISGLRHIMAVSGLHLGFIVMLFVFISKRLRLSHFIYIPVILAFFVAYAMLIGLSPSIFRAILMSAVGLLTTINGKRRDALSSLMFSLCIVVSTCPVLFFEAGFALSFSAVFGLILFSGSFEKLFKRVYIPRFIASPLSVSVAVQIGIFPAMAFYFSQMQVYSVIANIVLMPLIMVSFLAIMVVLPGALLFPFLVPLLHFAGSGLVVIDGVASLIARLPYSSIFIYASVVVFACYPLLFLISKYTMLIKYKKITSLCLSFICLSLMFMPTIALSGARLPINNAIIPINAFSDVTTIIINDGEVNIIGDLKSAAPVKKILLKYNLTKISSIVVFNITPQVAKQIASLRYFVKIGAIYCPESGLNNEGLSKLVDNGINNFYVYDDSAGNSVKALTPVLIGKKTAAFIYAFNNVNVLLTGYSSDYSKIDVGNINSAHIVRSFVYNDRFPDRIYLTNMPQGFLSGELPDFQFSLAESPEIIFDAEKGQIIKL